MKSLEGCDIDRVILVVKGSINTGIMIFRKLCSEV